jgi:hypothetical protein
MRHDMVSCGLVEKINRHNLVKVPSLVLAN